ncbi:MAG: YigZ family protein [Prolixibacteraceae bacterium]|nr:YigZ family protein [Prolixibacteraceae bacterium]MBN2649039.1 YigZ family protein [Prolixibacteraceae bacterium]
METNDTFKTIASASEGLFKDKGSKFIAYAYPVKTEDEIKEHIKVLKDQHYKARHHCYAFRLGKHGDMYRANDDGEPSGTAGRPIYGQLLSFELTNILVVVVRYFGGILLGTSGLINAYKTATSEVLSQATFIDVIVSDIYQLRFDYTIQSQVERVIKEFDLNIANAVYEMDCTYEIEVRKSISPMVADKFEKIEGLKLTLKYEG